MELIDSILSAQNILIVGHIRPDGDSLGAGLALYTLAANLGKKADIVYDSDLPMHYAFLQGFDVINKRNSETYDLLLIVDCGDDLRMGRYNKMLPKSKSIQFDHHITNNGFANINYVYPEKSSTCEILADLLLPLGYVDEKIASLLYTGLSTDTGHFMHNNVTPNVFETAARLMEKGAKCYQINCSLYRSKTINKTKLMGRAISSMKFFAGNKICVISVGQSDLEDCGCELTDTEGLIDLAMDMACVEVAVCMTEQPNEKYKISFRSKGFNVAECAACFGGGGHVQAAGCVAFGSYDEVLSKVVNSILKDK